MENPVRDTHPLIVGTAGHIDHGKTALVRALTGVDLDSLPEEVARGITIALGFTRLQLPSGRQAAFVDVPGHERLVRTMIAGASGVDAVLLCVSAQEGVMPQTREHLEILRLLGVQEGVVAITRADLVEEEFLELAIEDVRDFLAGSFLEGAPVVVTSAVEPRGLEDIREALDSIPPLKQPVEEAFRLPIDRCFVRKGFGSVVTGTARAGRVRDGQELELLPGGKRLRVRGIQVHGQVVGEASAGMRTALNLSGVGCDELPRGSVLVEPGSLETRSILDIRYHHLPSAPVLDVRTGVRILIGTAEVMGTAEVIELPDQPLAPGESRYLQIRCASPIAALPGDRVVLRRESPVRTLGGGVVLDPWARRFRRRDAEKRVEVLARMEVGDSAARLESAGPVGLDREEARRRLGEADVGESLGDMQLTLQQRTDLEDLLVEKLEARHRAHPLATGVGRRELYQGRLALLGTPAFDALVRNLVSAERIVEEGPRLRTTSWQVALNPAQEAGREQLLAALEKEGLNPSDPAELTSTLPQAAAIVALLIERGEIRRVAGRLYHAARMQTLVAEVRELLAREGSMNPGRFKALTSLSRRGAIPLLEWLTLRQGDTRVAGKST
jgi:selenocysteine-specific elongation factor